MNIPVPDSLVTEEVISLVSSTLCNTSINNSKQTGMYTVTELKEPRGHTAEVMQTQHQVIKQSHFKDYGYGDEKRVSVPMARDDTIDKGK